MIVTVNHFMYRRRKMTDKIKAAADPNAETVTNEKGAKQSKVEARFDLIDGPALFEMASVLHTGAVKYGANNWRGIDVELHLNHLIMHAYAYLSGDRSDDHLSHIMCRSMFAQAVHITNEQIESACKLFHPGDVCKPGHNHPAANDRSN